MMSDKVGFPKEGTIYDWMYDKNKKEWVDWIDTVPAYSVDTKNLYNEVVVPTQDSIRM
jgi:dynein heavy chain